MANEPEEECGAASADVPAVNATNRMTGAQVQSIVWLILVQAALVIPTCLGLYEFEDWHSYPFALVYAQGYLLAAFLALGQQSPALRWAIVALCVPLWWFFHMLVEAHYAEYGWSREDPSLAAVSATWGLVLLAVIAVVLWCCRLWFGFQWTTSYSGGRRKRTQFRLRQLLVWMAAAAAVCGMIRAGLPKSGWEPLSVGDIGLGFTEIEVYLFGLALAIPCTLAAVGRHRWRVWWLALPLYYVFLVVANSLVDVWRWSQTEVGGALGHYYSIAYATGILTVIGSILWVRATFERPAATASAGVPAGDRRPLRAPRPVPQKTHAVSLFGLLLACLVILDLSFAAASFYWTPTQVLMAEGVLCGQCTLLGGWLVLGRARPMWRTVWGILALAGLGASAILLRLSIRMAEPFVYDRPWTWETISEGVLFLLWFRRTEPNLWTCAWPAGVVLAITLLTVLTLQLFGDLREGSCLGRRHAARPSRKRLLVKRLAGITLIVAVVILVGLVMSGEDNTDMRYFDFGTWQSCVLLVSQVLVHVLSAAFVIAWMGQRTPRLRSWLIPAAVIVVCGGVAATDAPSLMFRMTTVIAVHLATLAAGLAVVHAANRGRPVFLGVPEKLQ